MSFIARLPLVVSAQIDEVLPLRHTRDSVSFERFSPLSCSLTAQGVTRILDEVVLHH